MYSCSHDNPITSSHHMMGLFDGIMMIIEWDDILGLYDGFIMIIEWDNII